MMYILNVSEAVRDYLRNATPQTRFTNRQVAEEIGAVKRTSAAYANYVTYVGNCIRWHAARKEITKAGIDMKTRANIWRVNKNANGVHVPKSKSKNAFDMKQNLAGYTTEELLRELLRRQ